jgi:hypothetical protein
MVTNTGTAAEATREPARWELLRVWHLEAMECVIHSPTPATFIRTSYISAPACWSAFPPRELATRIEHVLHAHYRVRAATLRTPDVDERMLPFAFDFEWVTRDDTAGTAEAHSRPWLFPCAIENPRLSEIALHEIDAALRAARPGIDARCYGDAFEVFRVDEDDTWHIIDWDQRVAMFAGRYETQKE